MIEFLTLFLGLVGGPQVVEVAVDSRVAAVEMRLDGEQIGRLETAPWRLEIDLGPRLAVRELVAVAFDDSGIELGRAAQYLNRPRPLAEAGILLERDEAGKAVAARLTWGSVVGRLPIRKRSCCRPTIQRPFIFCTPSWSFPGRSEPRRRSALAASTWTRSPRS